jgi:hypothetical protein
MNFEITNPVATIHSHAINIEDLERQKAYRERETTRKRAKTALKRSKTLKRAAENNLRRLRETQTYYEKVYELFVKAHGNGPTALSEYTPEDLQLMIGFQLSKELNGQQLTVVDQLYNCSTSQLVGIASLLKDFGYRNYAPPNMDLSWDGHSRDDLVEKLGYALQLDNAVKRRSD